VQQGKPLDASFTFDGSLRIYDKHKRYCELELNHVLKTIKEDPLTIKS